MPLDWPNLAASTGLGFVVGILAASAYDRIKIWLAERDNNIQITSPRAGEVLREFKELSPGTCFRVAGHLGTLPPDHKIWLLVQPYGQRGYWPQVFDPVLYDPSTGEWHGYVFEPVGAAKITIFAVVAPPSSQHFFHYYQRHGNATKWAPLDEIPSECINRERVEAQTK